jgi:hypothetical protein
VFLQQVLIDQQGFGWIGQSACLSVADNSAMEAQNVNTSARILCPDSVVLKAVFSFESRQVSGWKVVLVGRSDGADVYTWYPTCEMNGRVIDGVPGRHAFRRARNQKLDSFVPNIPASELV